MDRKSLAESEIERARLCLDSSVKNIFSNREIIARLLKSCVKEYGGYSVREIISEFLDGDGCGEYMANASVEYVSVPEGRLDYDVLVQAGHPGYPGSKVGIIINIEEQNKMRPGYQLINRAVYYCSRLISAQKNRNMTGTDYDALRPVCSIWICPDAPPCDSNLAHQIVLTEQKIGGGDCQPHFMGDGPGLISIFFLTFNAGSRVEDESGIISFLRALLCVGVTEEERRRIFESQGWITDTLKQETGSMGSYSEYVYSKGIEKGIEKGREEGREEGKILGMEACVFGMLSVQAPEEKIIDLLKSKFGLGEDQARNYITENSIGLVN